MSRKKNLVVPPDVPPDVPPPEGELEVAREMQLYAANLRDMLTLPEGHEGREEQVQRFQKLLTEQGVVSPPTTYREAIDLVNQIGEFNG